MRKLLSVALIFLISIKLIGQVKNPFDIIRSTQDTVEKLSPIEANQTESTKLEGDNPFSISHIPIRKNQYAEIENLTTTQNTGRENISLAYLPLWIIIISLCLIAYQLFIKRDHLAILIKSLTNDNYMRMTNYEENGGRSVGYFIGYLIFLLNFSLFLYLILTKHFGIDRDYFYLILLGLAVLFFVGKHFINTFFGWLFNASKESQIYDFAIITNYNLMAAIFLIINIFLVFGAATWVKPLAILGVLMFIIFLLSRYYKGLKIGHSYLNNYFLHFFLYFCAFEISPWFITYSLVRNLI